MIWERTEVITAQHLIKTFEHFLPIQIYWDALVVSMVFNYVLLKHYNELPSYKRKFRWWLYVLGLIICYICIAILSLFIFVIHSALGKSFLDSLKTFMCYVRSCLPFLLKQTAGSTCTCLESTKKKIRGKQERLQVWHCFTSKTLSLNLFWGRNSLWNH